MDFTETLAMAMLYATFTQEYPIRVAIARSMADYIGRRIPKFDRARYFKILELDDR